MNARTLRKHLMKTRERNFWGDRAYLTVRLPVSLVGAPRPSPLNFPGLVQEYDGWWTNESGSKHIRISQVFSSKNPETNEDLDCEPHFIEKVRSDWVYWTGEVVTQLEGDDTPVIESLPQALIAQHKALVDWMGKARSGASNPILESFCEAGDYARSTNWQVDEAGDFLYVTYGVKWRYPQQKLRFCADLSRALKLAKASGVSAKVHS